MAKGNAVADGSKVASQLDLNVQVIPDHGGWALKRKEEDRRIDAGDGKLGRTHPIWLALNMVQRATSQETWVAHNLYYDL